MFCAVNVLALYDIHGNIDALEAVLADAPEPDLVLVGGDAVRARSRPPRSTGSRSSRRAGCAGTGAGGRRGARAPDARAPTTRRRDRASSAPTSSARNARAPLGELPLTVELDGVLYCHATPRERRGDPHADSAPTRATPRRSPGAGPIVVAGHTHQQHDRTVGPTRFINAGSVGLPYEGDGAARWLWVADGVPELRSDAPTTRRRPGGA